MKEDKASWISFFQWPLGRGLAGIKLVIGDKCLGMLKAVGEVFPETKYQRCTVHFYRNVFSVTPCSKMKVVAKMLKILLNAAPFPVAGEGAFGVFRKLQKLSICHLLPLNQLLLLVSTLSSDSRSLLCKSGDEP